MDKKENIINTKFSSRLIVPREDIYGTYSDGMDVIFLGITHTLRQISEFMQQEKKDYYIDGNRNIRIQVDIGIKEVD